MVASYLSTDIIVIIVLVVVLVFIGICAFFIHFYWTKIGVSEIWNTTKWSSMRSSFYRTIGRFSQGSNNKFSSEQRLSGVSISSDNIKDVSIENKRPNPKITTYIASPSSTVQNPVSAISYNNPVRNKYGTKIGQPIQSTKIHNIHEYNNN